MEPARILMALILSSSVLVAQTADEQTTKTPRSDSSTLAPLMRPKRVIVFRPLFVYRQQEVRKQRIRDEPKSASSGDSYYSQRPSSSSASSYYNNQLQPYQPYYPAYWPPTSSASSYWPPAPAVNPYYPSYPSYPSSGSAYYRPATTTTRRPRTTTEKFRPYPFWG